MEISLVFRVHPSEEVLEEYAFGRLSGDHLSTVEEHLLVCEACQTELEHTDQYIRLVKTAAAQVSAEPQLGFLAGAWSSIRTRIPAPTAAWIGVLGSACLLALIFLPRSLPPLPAPAPLQSYRRGEILRGEDAAINLAPASRPLDFSIRVEDVPAKPEYRLEVVTDAGRTVWAGTAKAAKGELMAHMKQGLRAGHYWVRLYDQKLDLLSEFGLRLK